MDFTSNVSPVEVVNSGVNDRWYKNRWKEFEKLEGTEKKYYCFDVYDFSLNFYRVNVEQA